MDLEKEIEQIVKQVIENEISPYLERIKGFQNGKDGQDGRDGEDYVLTEQDKKEIASSIKVPVVEKVIEKREIVKEQPIIKTEVVKEIIKEVRNDDATIGYLDGKITAVDDDFKRTIAEITKKFFVSVGGIKELRAGTSVTIDNTNPQYPIVNVSGGSVTVETPVGLVNASNTVYIVTAEPKFVIADNATYFDGAGYTYSALQITMDIPPSSSIRAII